ncbi:MAG: PUA domain-containing protein, partial [Myxococcota bacterium]
ARVAARLGVPTVIASGKRAGVLEELARGEDVGTLLTCSEESLAGKKVWLGAGARSVGVLVCDAGAVRAVVERGASLLPKGIVGVEGEFEQGAVVDLRDEAGEVFGRGASVYASSEVRKIMGAHTGGIEDVLGYKIHDAAVHRDTLLVW